MRGLKDKMAIGMRMLGIIALTLLTSALVTYAADDLASKIKSFTPGTTIKASDMNSNFQAIISGMPAAKVGPPNDTLYTLSGTAQNLTSVTVTPPMDGILLLIASFQARLDGGPDATGAADIQVCISDTSGLCGSGGGPGSGYESKSISLAAPAPTTSIYFPVTFITARQGSANTSVTYYLTAYEPAPAAGLCRINAASLWAIFLPALL